MTDRKPAPTQGKGERSFDCMHYSDCLDLAAGEDWKGFHCEVCTSNGEASLMNDKITDNAKICKECNAKPVIAPHSDYCASCMAKRSNEARAHGKPHKKLTRRKACIDKPQQTKPRREPNAALTIDFGKYDHVLTEIRELAEEEMRPVDLQVVYILKNYLEGNRQHEKVH